MIKMLGIILVIISGSAGGYFASVRLSRKVRFIEEFLEFVQRVKNEIRYTRRPIAEIVQNHVKSSQFYSYIKTCLELNKKGVPFPTAWKNAFYPCKDETGITSELFRLITDFGENIGSGDTEAQINYCEYTSDSVKIQLDSAKKDRETKGKLYKILGTCAGAIAALVFI